MRETRGRTQGQRDSLHLLPSEQQMGVGGAEAGTEITGRPVGRPGRWDAGQRPGIKTGRRAEEPPVNSWPFEAGFVGAWS